MSDNNNYALLLHRGKCILDKYSLGAMATGFSVEQIHQHFRDNAYRFVDCNTFDKANNLANELMYRATGFPVTIDTFISSPADLQELYSIFIEWHTSLLGR